MFEGYIVDWQYSGPYLADKPFEEKFAPELDPGKSIEWKQISIDPTVPRPYVMDFNKIRLLGGDNRAVYLRTNVFSPIEQQVDMVKRGDDGNQVWVNGEIVHSSNNVKVNLIKGWNPVMVKVAQGGGGWSACVALRKNDAAVPGLKSQSVLEQDK